MFKCIAIFAAGAVVGGLYVITGLVSMVDRGKCYMQFKNSDGTVDDYGENLINNENTNETTNETEDPEA